MKRSKARAPKRLPKLRQAYVDEVAGLANRAKELRNAGHSVEEIARTLHAERRALGKKYKKFTPPDKLKQIYARNLKRYKDKFGPSFDHLRNDMDKSFEEIIKSATRPGGKDLGF